MMTTPTKAVDFEAEMKSAFQVFDMDNSGTISLEELRKVMKSFGEILTEDELDNMIKEVDKNGDGTIDCSFLRFLPSPPKSLHIFHLETLANLILFQMKSSSVSWSTGEGSSRSWSHASTRSYFHII
jgi:hypothetical protein